MPYLIGSIGNWTAEPTPLHASWWLIAMRGVAAILFGVSALVLPRETFFALVLLFSALCMVDGVVNLVLTIRCMIAPVRWSMIALHAVVSLAVGASILLYPPIIAAALIILFAFWAIISGALMIDLAIDSAHRAARVMLATIGGFNLMFGLFLVLSPLLGVLVLTWWIGLNAIVVGMALVAFALGLRTSAGGGRSKPANA